MKPWAFLLAGLVIFRAQAETAAFQARVSQIMEYQALLKSTATPGYAAIAARLKLHRTPELCSQSLIELLDAGPSGDMFWMYPVTAIAYLDQGQLSPEARQKLRDSWRTYMPYRGDTENHWLLYYTSLYLAAQLWPNEPGERWYTGKSSQENLRKHAAGLSNG